MPLPSPILDNRSFAQLKEELIRRIPVYNPQWTDYNESDPGITLLELFAFHGEGLLFRFNQVPEATKLAFLKLLNQPLLPAQPARAILKASTDRLEGVLVKIGKEDAKAGKLAFRVETEAHVWPLSCVAVARRRANAPNADTEHELYTYTQASLAAVAKQLGQAGGQAAGDVVSADAKSGQNAEAQPIYYDTVVLTDDGKSESVDFGNTVDRMIWIAVLMNARDKAPQFPSNKQAILNIGFSPDIPLPGLRQIDRCRGTGGSVTPKSVEWQVCTNELDAAGNPVYKRLTKLGDTTAGLTQAGVVRLQLPLDTVHLAPPSPEAALAGTGNFPPVLDGERAERLAFWLRAYRTDKSYFGAAKLICLNAVETVQAVMAKPEFLGEGNGQPNQAYRLANSPVLADTANFPVKLEVEESGNWMPWQQVEDFDASTEDDRHFRVDAESAMVHFGERGPQIGERVRVLAYRHGGGAAGNVPASAIGKLSIDGIKEVSNPLPAAGGADAENIEAALARIPGEIRRRGRAVTSDDFRELAFMTPGANLGRAECLPLFHAPTLEPDKPGVVSVMIWPKSDASNPNAPIPDEATRRTVCEWLDRKRLVTTELYVIPPVYRRIAVSVAIKVKPGYGLEAVSRWVELVLHQFLAPLPPYGPEGEGWPLGRRVYDRELEAAAIQVDGVEYIEKLRLAQWDVDKGGWSEAAAVLLKDYEVAELYAVAVVDAAAELPPPGQGIAPPLPTAPVVPIPVLRESC